MDIYILYHYFIVSVVITIIVIITITIIVHLSTLALTSVDGCFDVFECLLRICEVSGQPKAVNLDVPHGSSQSYDAAFNGCLMVY